MKIMNIQYNRSDYAPTEFLQINATAIASLRDHKERYDEKVEALRIVRENGRNDWQILFVISGTMDIYAENGVLQAVENDICVFPPKLRNDYVFKINKEGKSTAAYYIHYTGTAIDDIMAKTGISEVSVLKNMSIEVRRQFEWVLKYHKNEEKYSALGTLLLLLSSLKSQDIGDISDHKRRIQKAADYISLHYTEDIDIDNCARLCNMSRGRFAHLFKEKYGVPPHGYMLNLRLKHSEELLRYSSLTVGEIAVQCGFSDAYYFTRLFTKNYGVPPTTFRETKGERK